MTKELLDIEMARCEQLEEENKRLKAKNQRMREALEKVASIGIDTEIGQIVDSEHYEKAWLDCLEIAKEALKEVKE